MKSLHNNIKKQSVKRLSQHCIGNTPFESPWKPLNFITFYWYFQFIKSKKTTGQPLDETIRSLNRTELSHGNLANEQ